MDLATYAKTSFLATLDLTLVEKSFVRYRKYSRADVFRLLGCDENPVAQNVGGYLHLKELNAFPIFVTYQKSDDIASSTKYEDRFKSRIVMDYFSKNRRTKKSPCMSFLYSVAEGLPARVPLFVQKNNDEGIDFYYLGEVVPVEDSFYEAEMPSGDAVVRLDLSLKHAVPRDLYEHLTN
jgi:hypothetical protein